MSRKDSIQKMRDHLVTRRDALRKALAGDLSLLMQLREQSGGDVVDAALDAAQDEVSSQLAEVEKQCEIADAVEETATRLCHAASAGWACAVLLYFRPDWWAWVIMVVAYFAVFFLLKRPYDKMWDAAHDSHERLTETGRYWKGSPRG